MNASNTLALVSMRPAPRRARFMRSAPRIGSVEATLKRLADGLLAPEALPTMNRHIADDGAGWRGPRGVFRSIPSKESTNEHERHTARRVAVHHDERRRIALLQGLGSARRAADRLQPWMAAERGQLGFATDVLRGPRLSRRCARPPWSRPLQPAVGRPRHGPLRG